MNFIERIKEFRRRCAAKHKQYIIERETERAESLFQVCENDGELWFTYDDNLICPTSMLTDDAITFLNKVRELYISSII